MGKIAHENISSPTYLIHTIIQKSQNTFTEPKCGEVVWEIF